MSESTAAEAYQQQYRLAWREHWLYCKLFKWYRGECLKVKPAGTLLRPPAFEPALREILARARNEWTERTGLPRLDACNPETWWTAAIAARMEGQPVPNIRELTARDLAGIILPWALAKTSVTDQVETRWSKADSPEAWAGVYGVSVRTFTRWVRNGKIQAKAIDSKNIMVDVRDLPTRNR
jgi:hypothetical protein